MGQWTPKKGVSQTGTCEQMEKINVWWPEVHLNAENMARLAIAAYKLTSLEMAMVKDAETYGSKRGDKE